MARKAEPFKCFIDPDDELFIPSGNIPKRVREYCRRTEQYVPVTDGEVMRCIYESLAMKYRSAIEELEICTKKKYNILYMIGGGTKDKFLSQLTASACGIRVSSGPVEATALGNIIVQLLSSGDILDIESARKIIANSEQIFTFEPENADEWENQFMRFYNIITKR